MEKLMLFGCVGLGGAIGAMLRYAATLIIGKLPTGDFPYAIMTINILGSFLMGILVGIAAHRYAMSLEMRSFLAVGVLGGFTTFSSFSLDIVTLMQRGQALPAMIYMSGSIVLSVMALMIGMMLMRPVGA